MTESVSPLPERGPTGRRTAKGSLAGKSANRVERPAPLRQVVYDALAELIINRTLEPGQHLVEADLAEYLGVSRQPVREALQRLQSEGWVDLRPAQGAFVHLPTDEEADQLLGVRAVLETHSARLAAACATDEDIKRLWELQDVGMKALAADDSERLVAANADLHAYITELTGNAVLSELIGLVDRRVRWYYTPIARPRGRDAWQEHAALIEAIAAHNVEKAEKIMAQHTERTRQAFHERPDAPE
ncbi:GntR family transcriptional regulator [Amycolatopsis echigonensis]|uniref:GntR family transcriptional regulator n=1 Tax=Amycolatopsis echigonensis TaxID=2576905 RepID=A0A2N3WU96_9PSEU|nr:MULTISPECIES: GntR family transcriptional regulator [Amycolatopsis]MBB2503790.1 GntR family transcriptional regulator [Amycolatopsis echigonensis]PKV97450.1 GntR family transcriptional regulator [Amycolatopsis niigatensis]